MACLTFKIREDIISSLHKAVLQCTQCRGVSGAGVDQISLMVPEKKEFGDYSSNVALVLAPSLNMRPRDLAVAIVQAFPAGSRWVKDIQIAGPGFINFYLKNEWLHEALHLVHREGERYGWTDYGARLKVLVEFVSANPTGPMNVVSARAGAVGDTLCNILQMAGYDVWREFYVNDAGHQVLTLGESLEVRYRQALGQQAELPESAYPGEYLVEMAKHLVEEKGDSMLHLDESSRREFFSKYAVERIISSQKKSLEQYSVRFDRWFSEKSLHLDGSISRAIDLLTDKGCTFKEDDALWFRSTAFGDDKDRVLVRGDGTPTYFAPDIAYHLNKFQRGFRKLIDIWGPDHHGYIPRMKAAVKALGYDDDAFEVMIVQMVRLVRGKETVRMSKRAGEFVTMDDLLEEVGKDVARFFFLMRSCESHLDFDLDLGKLETSENPVYYVQYAHARICSIFREAQEKGMTPGPGEPDLNLLTDESEIDLMKRLAEFPEEIIRAAKAREPHRLTRYLMEVATLFHGFYTRCRILGDDPQITAARLYLSRAAQIVLNNALMAVGVSAPQRM